MLIFFSSFGGGSVSVLETGRTKPQVKPLMSDGGSPRIRWTMRFGALVYGALCGSFATAWASDPGVTLTAHRAVYDLSFSSGPNTSGFDTATGRIVYEVKGSACEGFTQIFRQRIVFSGSQSGPKLVDTYSTSFETADGQSLTFSSHALDNDTVPEDTVGEAQRQGNQMRIRLTAPTRDTLTLQADILFPIAYNRALAQSAVAGQHFFEAFQYDGADKGRTMQHSFAVIGKEKRGAEGLEPVLVNNNYATLRHWPVTVSYATVDEGKTGDTDYAVSMDMFEDGVSRGLSLEFPGFTLKGTLVEFERLPTPPCT
jgi:hypothetical protein